MAEATGKSKRGVKGWLWLGVKFLGGLFVTVHVYALILFFAPVPGTANMAIRAIEGERLQQDWEPLERISPHLVRAVIAAEDSGFCGHGGVSWVAIQEALEERRETGRMRGASPRCMSVSEPKRTSSRVG